MCWYIDGIRNVPQMYIFDQHCVHASANVFLSVNMINKNLISAGLKTLH